MMNRTISSSMVTLMLMLVAARAEQTVSSPITYQSPASITLLNGVPLLGTWDFSAATVIGLAGTGGGTVTSFSAGNLSPLFTTAVSTPTVTPSLSFLLSNAGPHTVFGNASGSIAAPSYTNAPAFERISNLTTNGFIKTTNNNGSLTVDTNTYLTGNQTITISGDATGSGTTAIPLTLANIPTGVPLAGSLLATNIASPPTPASGKTTLYVDAATKNFSAKNDAGVVNHGIQSRPATANNWIRSIADDGSTTISRPAFTDLAGNISVTQMNSGIGASASTFWRGDGTWSSIPNAGIIAPTTDLLVGDGAGNAIASGWVVSNPPGSQIVHSVSGAFDNFIELDNHHINGMSSVVVTNNFVSYGYLRIYGSGAPVPAGVAPDELELAYSGTVTGAGLAISTNARPVRFVIGGTERSRILNGLAVGTTTDPGTGVINVSTGYRIGNAAQFNKSLVGDGTSFVAGDVPGKVSVTTTVDQTSSSETAHISYTVPANSVAIGTTFRIAAWGNMDASNVVPVTFTPRIRWGGTSGTELIAAPTVSATSVTGIGRSWKLEAYVTIRATGAAGTATCVQAIEHHAGSSGAYASDEADSGITAVTIDTTVNKALVLSWSLSNSTGSPHVRTFGGVIEIVKP